MYICSLNFLFSSYEGVTSNTDAAQLAETFAEAKCATKVHLSFLIYIAFFCSFMSSFSDHVSLCVDELIPSIEQVVGVPVTLNGDLKNQFVETTVGFDTICKVGLN